MTKIILQDDRFGNYIVAEIKKNGRDQYFQTDWDFPMVAELFGHVSRYKGNDPSLQIASAVKYLDDHIGKVILSDFFDNFE